MARMGDWRDNKDVEIPLDGIGGVNILVKADVHRAGAHEPYSRFRLSISLTCFQASTFPAMRLRIKPKQKALRRWPNERGMESMASRIMWYGILIQKRSLVMHDDQERGLEEEEEEEGGREGCNPILPYLPVLMKMSFICAPPSSANLYHPAILIVLSQRILLFVHGHVKARMNMVCLVS